MKRFLALCIVAGLITVSAWSQRIDDPEIFWSFGFLESEISRIQEIQQAADRDRQAAQVELDVYKAQLAKLLLEPEVDMTQVERLLRESSEWRVKAELAAIKGRVALRRALGEDKWNKYLQALRAARWRRAGQFRSFRQAPGQQPRE